MQPYEIIDNVIEDVLADNLNENYCLLSFPDHIRFDHTLTNRGNFLRDKSQHNNQNVYHRGEWLESRYIDESTAKLYKQYVLNHRYVVDNNVVQHSFEPVYYNYDKDLWDYFLHIDSNHTVLHSEYNSNDIKKLENLGVNCVHWFAHAYLCSEFYFKHYEKLSMVTDYQSRPIKYPWISANRLLRDYRIDFLHRINFTKGAYSLLETDPWGNKLWGIVPPHSFDYHGNDSAEINVRDLTPWNTSFLHIVNETVWQDKIHFTEKVFKPIVMHQPFVVLQAPGSLEYLRSYGFKTFGDWWDESYDTIQDPEERMIAIAEIVDWIPDQDLYKLRNEMSGVLEHNFRHFYENIPDICLDELGAAIQATP